MNNEKINKLIEETLNSFDGAEKAAARPFLFTRLAAKMHKKQETQWDNALHFLSKPAVVAACILLVIVLNASVFTYNQSAAVTTDEQYAASDYYSNDVVVLNDIENIEP
jgi:hypothetical protein